MSPLRYDVAALANLKMEIPIQKKLVETICDGLEQDDEWDETQLFEKAYKEAGLKRYKLDKKLLTSRFEKETYTESVGTSSSKDGKAAPKALPGEPEIKIQNPTHVELITLARTTKSAGAAVATLAQHFKKILPSLLVMDSSLEGLLLLNLFDICAFIYNLSYQYVIWQDWTKSPNVGYASPTLKLCMKSSWSWLQKLTKCRLINSKMSKP